MRQDRTVVMVCRDCCCGSRKKHPRTDHHGQLTAFEQAAEQAGVEVRVVDCLDECDRSNVAVVRRHGLPKKERDTWLGSLVTESATDAVAQWLAEGAGTDLPPRVEAHAFRKVPPRRR